MMGERRDSLDTEGLSKGRIEAFSDGVFAIVITLLILEIKVPEIPTAQVTTELLPRLQELTPKLLSYVTSFLVIGTYWVAHHNAFHYARRGDRLLLWINILYLMCLTFIPFPTALLGEYAPDSVAVAIYGVTLLVTAIVFNGMWWYIAYSPGLLRPETNPRVVKQVTRGGILGLVAYTLALALAFMNPPLSITLQVLLPIFFIMLNIYWTR
ncbi:MAG: DUF1211 domain-containing protein [Desertifilum sp. SIO1I2]|nr:DUF1211 domain-containing protein [Desertifilum sp. SIO1I2]